MDVTLSVWNRFRSEALAGGLVRAGYRVRVLGSVRRPPPCHEYRMNWTAGLLTQAALRMPRRFINPVNELALCHFERFAARNMGEPRCLWGWNNHNLMAFKKARQQGAFTVVETGSTHVLWQNERVGREYEKRGLSQRPGGSDALIGKALQEYALVDRICIPCRFVEQTFLDYGIPKGKLHINPFGVDGKYWRNSKRQSWRQARRPLTFVFAGQIALRKGLAYLLEAWAKARLTDARLILAGGDIWDFHDWMRHLPAGVEYVGYQSHEGLRELYSKSDVYLLPSLEEGMARSVLEAMAAGLPVIVTQETGVTDIMRDREDGWVTPSADVDSLSDVLREASDRRDELWGLGESAQRRVQPMTWEAYGDRCASFLLNLVGPPRGR